MSDALKRTLGALIDAVESVRESVRGNTHPFTLANFALTFRVKF